MVVEEKSERRRGHLGWSKLGLGTVYASDAAAEVTIGSIPANTLGSVIKLAKFATQTDFKSQTTLRNPIKAATEQITTIEVQKRARLVRHRERGVRGN